jgi:hypothetical protein
MLPQRTKRLRVDEAVGKLEFAAAMTTEQILLPVDGAAPAAADSRAQAWLWWHGFPSSAACLHRW